VAVTDGRGLWAAALALPGIVPGVAWAQSAPDQALFEFAYLNYRDWQPGRDRMTVNSPAIYTLLPMSDTTVFEAAVVLGGVIGVGFEEIVHDSGGSEANGGPILQADCTNF